MNCKWIIGAGTTLDMAHECWSRAFPNNRFEKICITQNEQYEFDLEPLSSINGTEGLAFIALDSRFGNFKRAELIQTAIDRGIKLASFISPRATVADNVKIGPNTFIADGVTVNQGSRIDYNSFLLSGVTIGSNVHVKPSCWLNPNVVIGENSQIGAHTIIHSGSIISNNIKIGRGCELGWTKCYDRDVAAKTIFDKRYDAPIYVYG